MSIHTNLPIYRTGVKLLEQRALEHGKELIKRALAREGFRRSTESIRGHLESIKRREEEAV